MKKHNDFIFFSILFLLILFFFRNAFTMGFFQDDYFFLKNSNISSLSKFINFFNPIRNVFYRPLASEVFYFILHLLKLNVVLGRFIPFFVYFIGLIFLYKILICFFNKAVAVVTVFLYSIHFTHVFQLYWFATFQEIALLMFGSGFVYFWITKRKTLANVFFICALLSKETAIFLTLIIIIYEFLLKEKTKKNDIFNIANIIVFLLTLVMIGVYRIGMNSVSRLENYSVQFDPKLIINNGLWYFLWTLGFPNFMPVYSVSLFKPLPEFWNIVSQTPYNLYFYPMFLFNVVLALFFLGIFILKRQKEKLVIFAIALFVFFIFIFPSIFIVHRWMVRLTLPLIGIALIYGMILLDMIQHKSKFVRLIGFLCLFLYVFWNYHAINVHEYSGLFNQEKNIYNNAKNIFNDKKQQIIKAQIIFIEDRDKFSINPFSKVLFNSFHNQDATDYFFPKEKIKINYDFNTDIAPQNSVIIQSNAFFK